MYTFRRSGVVLGEMNVVLGEDDVVLEKLM